MENIITNLGEKVPSLLLHSCCAPCSSACLEKLAPYFDVTVLYYNPNITNPEEYNKRLEEERRFIEQINNQMGFYSKCSDTAETDIDIVNNVNDTSGSSVIPFHPIKLIDGRYEPSEFFDIAKGLEKCPEGGERCFKCYELRLREAAIAALNGNYDYFTTTLTISPLKNASKLNEIGEALAAEYQIAFLPSDFKKKDGYKRSIALSNEYNLYRQNFCGCIYSQVNSQQV